MGLVGLEARSLYAVSPTVSPAITSSPRPPLSAALACSIGATLTLACWASSALVGAPGAGVAGALFLGVCKTVQWTDLGFPRAHHAVAFTT